jgi:hypothetical protein
MNKLALICATILPSLAAGDGAREITIGSLAPDQGTLVRYENRYLMCLRPLRAVGLWGLDGRRIYETEVSPPPSNLPTEHRFWEGVSDATVDNDGFVAAAVSFRVWENAPDGKSEKVTTSGPFGGIVVLDKAGIQTEFVGTGRYLPIRICFDRNHQIWTLGSERDGGNEFLLHEYSREGKQIGAYVQRSTLPHQLPISEFYGSFLRSGGDRIGALLVSGPASEDAEWFEVDLLGRLIGRWSVKEEYLNGGVASRGVALTASGKAYARSTQRISTFDASTASWKTVKLDSNLDRLLGADGEELVFILSKEDTTRLTWVTAPTQ